AAHALGEIGDQRATPPMLRLLADPELGPSNAAKLALQKLGWQPTGMADFFHHFLATGHIPSSSFPVASWEGEKVPGLLLPALQRFVNAHSEETFVIALARLGDAAALNRFISELKVDHADKTVRAHLVRCRAADALGEIGNPAAIEALIPALQDKKGDVRLA